MKGDPIHVMLTRAMIATTGLFVIGAAVSGAIAQPNPSTDTRSTSPLDPKTVVVLAVASPNLEPWLEERFVAFYEAFVEELRAVDGLTVVPPERALPFRGSLLPEEEIGRQLGAGTVIALDVHTVPPEFMITHFDA